MANSKEKLIECIPNFSEGRDVQKIEKIIKSIQSVKNINILHVHTGYEVNRSVITFSGPPAEVPEAAFRAIKKAAELIDMNQHKGRHPRIGATDVCPFVPLQNVSMTECVEISRNLAKRVGEEIRIPVYLYENSAIDLKRKNLPDIRRGGYEALAKKMKEEEWIPDFGPHTLLNSAGATVIGARKFLIALNINLVTIDVDKAVAIAERIRETGGKATKGKAGLFKNCRAIGWYISEYKCCQVSVNLTDFHITPPHTVFEAIKKLAAKKQIKVNGSELIGLIPFDALLLAGEFYNTKPHMEICKTEELLKIAIENLGLNSVEMFDPLSRILNFNGE